MSEDPIGFKGKDLNLFRYVNNQALSKIDPSGLFHFDPWREKESLIEQFFNALSDFFNEYFNMRERNVINSDKYFHCMANCRASNRGDIGMSTAEDLGDTREFLDKHLKNDSDKDCDADQLANRTGRNPSRKQSCEQTCRGYRVDGL
ncbi:hypothetical protein DAY19_11680 [Halobacteriovorax vibrionivorans]|uniref:Uncharacterized protein n=1 Tax=Halobacteriovorax vibrionivorans TaxID=2152716 RepID=A0ABY0ICF7_9BACT|nr:hypothetical protein DAY19_11680 [Halobacteriovorax vibrionivorans]TGD48973.1 hypothetical protein EP118_02050 [Halobacteriovorax sp. Y22]